MACLTAYIIYFCAETHYEKCLKKVSRFIHEQNEQVWTKRGLLITDPVERGLRVIEISLLTEAGPGPVLQRVIFDLSYCLLVLNVIFYDQTRLKQNNVSDGLTFWC